MNHTVRFAVPLVAGTADRAFAELEQALSRTFAVAK